MTRVDRLREDGWTECGTCGGSGKVASSCSDQCDYEVACPDCVDGRVPPDGMVDAAYSVLMGNGIHELPIDESDVRRALVAAARWEAPE